MLSNSGEIVKDLLTFDKCGIFHTTENNISALDFAKAMGHEEIVFLLTKRAVCLSLYNIRRLCFDIVFFN